MFRKPLITLAFIAPTAALAQPVHPGQTIGLRTHHGTYLVAEEDGRLNADRGGVGPWETFTILNDQGQAEGGAIALGDTISLRSTHGTYVVAEQDGNANANRPAVGGWEQFVVLNRHAMQSRDGIQCGDIISLRSWHNTYLVAEADGQANANRSGIGEWEEFTVECQMAPTPQRLTVADAAGLALDLAASQVSPLAPRRFAVNGQVTLERGGRRTTVIEAALVIELNADGEVETLDGRARVPMAAADNMPGFEASDFVWAWVGLNYGHALHTLRAPLQDELRYFFANIDAGLDLRAGLSGVSLGAGTTVIMDPADPFLFARGDLRGFGWVTPLQSVGIGVSANGQARLHGRRNWGIEDQMQPLDGHLYLSGRVGKPIPLPYTSLFLDGEMLVDFDPNHDGFSAAHADGIGDEHSSLGNGSLSLRVGIQSFVLANIEVADGSFIAHRGAHSDEVDVFFSGKTDNDRAGVADQLPLRFIGEALMAGRLSPDAQARFVQYAANLRVNAVDLFNGFVRFDDDGARVEALLDLQSVAVSVEGHTREPGDLTLAGSAQVRVPVIAPKDLRREVVRPVWFAADAGQCGYEKVTDGGRCGYDRVQCGTEWITDAGRCGVHTVWTIACGILGCQYANRCEVPRFCDNARTCDGPNALSCWVNVVQDEIYTEPEYTWGHFEGRLDAEVARDGLQAQVQARYCPINDTCIDLPGARTRIEDGAITLCGDVPELGEACVRL